MRLKRRPYKVYADEDGYRFSCRRRGCTGMGTHWLKREDAVTAAEDHEEKEHTQHDQDLEDWILSLGEDT